MKFIFCYVRFSFSKNNKLLTKLTKLSKLLIVFEDTLITRVAYKQSEHSLWSVLLGLVFAKLETQRLISLTSIKPYARGFQKSLFIMLVYIPMKMMMLLLLHISYVYSTFKVLLCLFHSKTRMQIGNCSLEFISVQLISRLHICIYKYTYMLGTDAYMCSNKNVIKSAGSIASSLSLNYLRLHYTPLVQVSFSLSPLYFVDSFELLLTIVSSIINFCLYKTQRNKSPFFWLPIFYGWFSKNTPFFNPLKFF